MSFVAKLANATDVADWSAKTFEQFGDELDRFLLRGDGRDPRVIPSEGYSGDDAYTKNKLALLQAHSRGRLQEFFAAGLAALKITRRDLADEDLIIEVVRDPAGGAALRTAAGPLVSVYVLAVAFLLASEAGARLRRCESLLVSEPGAEAMPCGKFFVRTGRKEYCTPTCRSRSAQRDFRERWLKPRSKGRK